MRFLGCKYLAPFEIGGEHNPALKLYNLNVGYRLHALNCN